MTRNNQEGVTLVISIVLLAAVTFVSFSLSTLIIREITGARLLLKSEPALSAANAGGEVGLYRLQRGQGSLNITDSPLSQSPATYRVDPDLYDDPYLFSFSCADTSKEFWIPLYDPSNWENKNADYGRVTITMTSDTCQLRVRVFTWTQAGTDIATATMNSGTNPIFTCNALNAPVGDDRYIISIQPQGPGTGLVTGAISAVANDLVTAKGIPSANPTLEVTGKSGEVERRLQIDLE